MVQNQCFKHELFEVPYVVFHDQKGVLNFLKNKKKGVIWTKVPIYAYFFQQILPLKSLSMNSSSSSDCSASKCVSSLSSRWLWSRELEWDEFDEPTEKKKFKALWNIRPNPFSKCHATLHKGWPLPKWFYFKTTFRIIVMFFSFDTISISPSSKYSKIVISNRSQIVAAPFSKPLAIVVALK